MISPELPIETKRGRLFSDPEPAVMTPTDARSNLFLKTEYFLFSCISICPLARKFIFKKSLESCQLYSKIKIKKKSRFH